MLLNLFIPKTPTLCESEEYGFDGEVQIFSTLPPFVGYL